jgi:DNA polymerase III subunit epsilon
MEMHIPITELEITVFDFETTGTLQGFENEPWQIGMVSLRQGRVDATTMFESLLRVDGTRPFNRHAPGRHAQLRTEIAAAPTMQDIWPQIGRRLTACPLCAHNVGTEKKFARRAVPMHRLGPWVDTLKLARRAWPGCRSYALEDLVHELSLQERLLSLCPGREAHDALYDAVASALMLEYLLRQSGWERVTLFHLSEG